VLEVRTHPQDPLCGWGGDEIRQLILSKIIEIVATGSRCQILRVKCTKIDFNRGFAPDPTGSAYSAHQIP